MIALAAPDAFLAAAASAASLEVSAYRLPPAVERTLEDSARRGAYVDVVLPAAAVGGYDGELAAANAESGRRLAAAGAVVRFETGTHLKAAVADGVAWLDDRNFVTTGPSNVVRDDEAADVARIRAAIDGDAVSGGDGGDDGRAGGLTVDKAAAIAEEAAAIRAAPAGDVLIESESFGYGEITAAIRARVAAGDTVRLLVDRRLAGGPQEASALAKMASSGVEVRTAAVVDKVAVAPDRAWLGSANATFAGGATQQQSDWGLVTNDPAILAELRRRAEATWATARPLVAAATPAPS